MAISEKEFKSLKDGDHIAMGKTSYVVSGKNEFKHPKLFDCETGQEYWMSYYVIHLMYPVDAPPAPKVVESVDEEVEQQKDVPVVEMAVPVKKKRGRPRKNPL